MKIEKKYERKTIAVELKKVNVFTGSGFNLLFSDFILGHKQKYNDFEVLPQPEKVLDPNWHIAAAMNIGSAYNDGKKIILGTHSQYILNYLNVLIKAYDKYNDTESKEEVLEIVPIDCHINFDDVAGYSIDLDGNVTDILDYNLRIIKPSEIDFIASMIEYEFNQLLEID